MKSPPFTYHRADSRDQAVALLARLDNARILAGGQSLVPMLALRYVFPDHLIDINPIADLAGIEAKAGRIRLGAMTRQRAAERHDGLRRAAPIFAEALAQVGHRQTRNRGTIGGSLCHLDPAAELPALALLYDATLTIGSIRGERRLAMGDFMAGFMTTAVEADEMLTDVAFETWSPRAGHAFLEHARRFGDFAIASAACLLEADSAGRVIERAALVVGGLADRPVRLRQAEDALVGAVARPDAFIAAGQTCLDLESPSDVHASADFRRQVAATLVTRALTLAWSRIGPALRLAS